MTRFNEVSCWLLPVRTYTAGWARGGAIKPLYLLTRHILQAPRWIVRVAAPHHCMLPLVLDGLKDGWTDAAPGAAGVQPGQDTTLCRGRCFSTSQLVFLFLHECRDHSQHFCYWPPAVAQSSPLCLLNLSSVLHCNVQTNNAGVYGSHTNHKIMLVLWRTGGLAVYMLSKRLSPRW